MGVVSDRLSALVSEGRLETDPAQAAAARALDDVLSALKNPARKGVLRRRLVWPEGLYLWGGVGRGKSMLMDWFYEAAQLPAPHSAAKRRVHFHAFMIDVHAAIHRHRQMADSDDPIPVVAESILDGARLLCFDEFHVTDITDAMILSRLFDALWAGGCTVVATSNRAPDDLYRNGLNRQLFTPFIDRLVERMTIHHFDGDTDHRLRVLTRAPLYHTPLGAKADAAVEQTWQQLIGEATPQKTILPVQGRELCLDRTAAGVARTSFAHLCERPLGAADYLGLAQSFQTVILENVPQLSVADRNAAKRFVTLIDALYETRTKLVMSSQVEPANLYTSGDGAFEFERTVSRLMEMRTEAYLGERRVI